MCLRHHLRLNKYTLYCQHSTLQRPFAMITVLLILCAVSGAYPLCNSSITTASGTKAPANICSEQLIFHEEFNTFDFQTWSHEITAAGGGVSIILTRYDVTCSLTTQPHVRLAQCLSSGDKRKIKITALYVRMTHPLVRLYSHDNSTFERVEEFKYLVTELFF